MGIHVAVFVVALLIGFALGWINLGDEVKNFAAGLLLSLAAVSLGAGLLVVLVPGTNLTPDQPFPTGGRIDVRISQWTEAIVNIVAKRSPLAFWTGAISGVGAFLYWKGRRGRS